MLLGGSGNMLLLEMVWILLPKVFFFGFPSHLDRIFFHSPLMKPCKLADNFIKVNLHVVVDIEQSESCQSVK